jgi:hypothetical protein
MPFLFYKQHCGFAAKKGRGIFVALLFFFSQKITFVLSAF